MQIKYSIHLKEKKTHGLDLIIKKKRCGITKIYINMAEFTEDYFQKRTFFYNIPLLTTLKYTFLSIYTIREVRAYS